MVRDSYSGHSFENDKWRYRHIARPLTESQRASIAARVANMPRGANQHDRASANLPTLPLSEQAAVRRADAIRHLRC